MDAGAVRRQPDFGARPFREFAAGAHNERAEGAAVNMQECVGAKMLGEADCAGPFA